MLVAIVKPEAPWQAKRVVTLTDRLSLLKPNTIIRGPIFPESVQVLVIVPMGTSFKLIGKGLRTGQVQEPILSLEQIAALRECLEQG